MTSTVLSKSILAKLNNIFTHAEILEKESIYNHLRNQVKFCELKNYKFSFQQMKMDQNHNENDAGSPQCMDNLAALNIVPFLGLMNLVEVKYFDMPEVYRTTLAILCDYDPLLQDNVLKTRRYLSELLAREPELAQCLLNFIDTPEQPGKTSGPQDGSATDPNKNPNHQNQQHTSEQVSARIPDEKPADHMQKETTPVPNQFSSDHGASSQSSQNADALRSDYRNRCLISIPISTQGQSQMQPSPVTVTEAPVQAVQTCDPQPTCSDLPMCKSVPFLNIYHKDLLGAEKSTVAVTRTGLPQGAPFFVPGLFTSHLTSMELDQATKPAAADDQSDQMMFTPKLTPSGGPQTHMAADSESASLLTPATECSNSNSKAGKHCSVAETQTLFTSAEKTTSLHDRVVPSAETPNPFRLSRIPPPATSSLETLMNMAASAGQSHTVSPNICLSKLLGQPGVAYLPAGHFIDSRSSLVDPAASKPTGVEKLPYTSSVLSSKTNSASAKLHLLSTQAGSDKSGLLQAGCGKASIPGPLSASVPLVHKDTGTMKTTVKVTSKPGCKKTITFSKIVPVLKVDCLTGQENKVNTQSYDKQIQVGQRQLGSKKSKAAGRDEQGYQVHSDATQHGNMPNSQENLTLGRQQLTDCQNPRPVFQSADTAVTNLDRERQQKDTQQLSVGQQKSHVTRKLRAIKQNSQISTPPLEEETVKPPASEQKPEKPVEQHKQGLLESQGDQKLGCGPDQSWVPTSQALVSDKARQQTDKGTSIKAGVGQRPKVQVVAVSMGSSHSLAAFPYIQQMILPDGQVSTITHNTNTVPASDQQQQQQNNAATSVCIASKPASNTTQEKDSTSKPDAQIVLPRSQLKLSVSIQTPTVLNCPLKKVKNTTTLPGDLPKLNQPTLMAESAPTCSEVVKVKGPGKLHKNYVDKTTLADTTNLLPDARPTGNSQGKRKRSPTSRRNVTTKAGKLYP